MQNDESFPHINTKWLSIAIIANIALITVCLIPIPKQAPQPFARTDLVVHLFSYYVITLLFLKACTARIRNLYIVALLILQGFLIELIQPSVGRYFEWLDCLANMSGSILSYLTLMIVHRFR
jgi:VanZ family protein